VSKGLSAAGKWSRTSFQETLQCQFRYVSTDHWHHCWRKCTSSEKCMYFLTKDSCWDAYAVRTKICLHQ